MVARRLRCSIATRAPRSTAGIEANAVKKTIYRLLSTLVRKQAIPASQVKRIVQKERQMQHQSSRRRTELRRLPAVPALSLSTLPVGCCCVDCWLWLPLPLALYKMLYGSRADIMYYNFNYYSSDEMNR